MKRQRQGRLSAGTFLIGLCLTLFLFSGAVVLILNLRWLYYLDIVLLDIEKKANMSVHDIRANYDVLIRYNSLFYRGDLHFPTLAMSKSGKIHFAEVKRIFDGVQVLCIVTGIASLFGIVKMRVTHNRRAFRVAGMLSLVIPTVLGVLAALWWDQFFVTFHHLFFRNDYWLFDPATDPVILMLPDAYFFHCVIGILALILLGGWCLLRRGRR